MFKFEESTKCRLRYFSEYTNCDSVCSRAGFSWWEAWGPA